MGAAFQLSPQHSNKLSSFSSQCLFFSFQFFAVSNHLSVFSHQPPAYSLQPIHPSALRLHPSALRLPPIHPSSLILHPLRTPHTVAAVVAEVAIAVAHGNGAAVVATGGIGLEGGELFVAGRRADCTLSHDQQ